MLSSVDLKDLNTGRTFPLSMAERLLPVGTNPIELHDLAEILATCEVTNLDTGERKSFHAALPAIPKVRITGYNPTTVCAAPSSLLSPLLLSPIFSIARGSRSRLCAHCFILSLLSIPSFTGRQPLDPMSLHDSEEVLAMVTVKNLDTGEVITLDRTDMVLRKVTPPRRASFLSSLVSHEKSEELCGKGLVAD